MHLPIDLHNACLNCKLNFFTQHMMPAFKDFVKSLVDGKHLELSPPFSRYYECTDIIEFFNEFSTKYKDSLKRIGEDVLMETNELHHDMIEDITGYGVQFDIIKEIENICSAIYEALVQQFKGFPSEAFERMEKAFTENHCHLLNLLPQLNIYDIDLYRVREGEYTDKLELFHVPFDKRNKCGTERFSIAGYPSLYLSGSIETAYKEAGIDVEDGYSGIHYRINDSKLSNEDRIIDLTLPNRELEFFEYYSLALFYPLIVICGLKVKDIDGKFKPEYIIPQLLTQVLRLHSNGYIHGIAFTSTRYDVVDFKDGRKRNFILFIPNADSMEGYSKEVAEKLVCTQPIVCPKGTNTSHNDLERVLNTLPLEKIL